MSRAPHRNAAFAFVLAAVLSAAAGLLPWIRGRAPNALFLVLALAWFVLSVAMLRRGRDGGPGRAD